MLGRTSSEKMQISSSSIKSIDADKPSVMMMMNHISSCLKDYASKVMPIFAIDLITESLSIVNLSYETKSWEEDDEIQFQLKDETQNSKTRTTSHPPHIKEPIDDMSTEDFGAQ